jgi:aspartyl/asparaginyl-tRNA synthetase
MAMTMHLDAMLARVIDSQLRSMRNYLERSDYTEVFVPHLTRNQTLPNVESFTVSAPGVQFEGALRSSSALYMASAVGVLGRAYNVGTSFRAEATTGRHLAEFRLVSVWGRGSVDDASQLAEDLIRVQLDSAERAGFRGGGADRSLRFQRVSYREMLEMLDLEEAPTIGFDIAARLCELHDNQPVLITEPPEDFDESLTDTKLDENGNHQGFILVSPAGVLMHGGELETDYPALKQQASRSRYLREFTELGGQASQIEHYLRSVGALRSKHFKLAFGFERVTQLILGNPTIEEATLIPVRSMPWGDLGSTVVIGGSGPDEDEPI